MGVDSGLPDFRGNEGFWRAYPALAHARLDFRTVASPRTFETDPKLAWGFYGHRLNLYRATTPHRGFAQLLAIAAKLAHGAFVFTSNVDGHFQKSGFAPERVAECHGSIHHLQCLRPCTDAIWPADGFRPEVDATRCRITSAPPGCPHCSGLARPNILMFGDGGWIERRARLQERALLEWLGDVHRPVVLELGAGRAVPTVRWFGEQRDVPMIRINPVDWAIDPRFGIGLAVGALDGIEEIAAALG
ncbi:MAG: NAD-dependent deacetylase [Burkholderiales bacterium]|nr:NAD-dependent deacetylase [Burkholderiales bacterium]